MNIDVREVIPNIGITEGPEWKEVFEAYHFLVEVTPRGVRTLIPPKGWRVSKQGLDKVLILGPQVTCDLTLSNEVTLAGEIVTVCRIARHRVMAS